MLGYGHDARLERHDDRSATADLERFAGPDDQVAQIILLGNPEHARAAADARALRSVETLYLEPFQKNHGTTFIERWGGN